MTAEQAASKLGVSPKTYGHWERGRPTTRSTTIMRLIDYIRLDDQASQAAYAYDNK